MPSHRVALADIAVCLFLLMGLFPISVKPLLTAQTKANTPPPAAWTAVNIPAEGEAGNWILAKGSDVRRLVSSINGTLYCYANPTGTTQTLFKSDDGGHTWQTTGRVTGLITDIAADPFDASTIYYSNNGSVFRSTDAGKTFKELLPHPGGAGSNNISISAINVSRFGGRTTLAVGTMSTTPNRFGGVYTLDDTKVFPVWNDTSIGSYNILDIEFSPGYESDGLIIAAGTDRHDTVIRTKVANMSWNATYGDACITGLASNTGTISITSSPLSANQPFYVALSSGNNTGDVFSVTLMQSPQTSVATDLNVASKYGSANSDVTALCCANNETGIRLMAGSGNTSNVYFSDDAGQTWRRSAKPPTGASITTLVTRTDSCFYASTSGNDSAFSVTSDGISWSQLALIDSEISSHGLADMAPSPSYAADGTLFLLTYDSTRSRHSLWQTSDSTSTWRRIYSTSLAPSITLSHVRLSPDYGKTARVVYLSGTSTGQPALWQSVDDGQTFTLRRTPCSVDILTVTGDQNIIVTSYNGSTSNLFSSANGGFFFSDPSAVCNSTVTSLAISPAYQTDHTILAGTSTGWVYCSIDDGATFKSVPAGIASAPLTGLISVAFDSDFTDSGIIYTGSDSAGKGIYRFGIGRSTKWERIDTSVSGNGTITSLVVSTNGTLYATNSQAK